MSIKTCRGCGTTKPLEEFYKHPQMADGRLNKCKACVCARVLAYRQANIERIRKYDRERAKDPERMRVATAVSRRWRREDKRRVAAHNAVARALRSGRLVRQPCERCGCEQSYAHHDDYDRKLDVRWLCQPCHKVRHKEMVLAGIEP